MFCLKFLISHQRLQIKSSILQYILHISFDTKCVAYHCVKIKIPRIIHKNHNKFIFCDKIHLITSDINWIRETLKKLTHSLAKIIKKIKTHFDKNINWKQMKK